VWPDRPTPTSNSRSTTGSWGRGLEPYPVQEQAIASIFAGKSVLVYAPLRASWQGDGPRHTVTINGGSPSAAPLATINGRWEWSEFVEFVNTVDAEIRRLETLPIAALPREESGDTCDPAPRDEPRPPPKARR
jgi:hypothetical protein